MAHGHTKCKSSSANRSILWLQRGLQTVVYSTITETVQLQITVQFILHKLLIKALPVTTTILFHILLLMSIFCTYAIIVTVTVFVFITVLVLFVFYLYVM